MEEKNDFWEDLDGLIESVSKQERIVLDVDLNGHVGKGNIGDEEIMGGTVLRCEIRKDLYGCGFYQENGFGNCQYLF